MREIRYRIAYAFAWLSLRSLLTCNVILPSDLPEHRGEQFGDLLGLILAGILNGEASPFNRR